MKNNKINATEKRLAEMNPDEYTRLRNSYYKAADGIHALSYVTDSLTPEEQAAVKELRAVLSKLKHLSACL